MSDGYTIRDFRGIDRKDREPQPTCRVCGAPEEHTQDYNTPTMSCIEHLRRRITALELELMTKHQADERTTEGV